MVLIAAVAAVLAAPAAGQQIGDEAAYLQTVTPIVRAVRCADGPGSQDALAFFSVLLRQARTRFIGPDPSAERAAYVDGMLASIAGLYDQQFAAMSCDAAMALVRRQVEASNPR